MELWLVTLLFSPVTSFIFRIGMPHLVIFFIFRSLPELITFCLYTVYILIMSAKYIISAIVGSFGIAWVCDHYISDKKLFGGKFCFSFGIWDWFALWLFQQYVTASSSFRYYSWHSFKQWVVGRDWQKVSVMASHCWSTSGHESH